MTTFENAAAAWWSPSRAAFACERSTIEASARACSAWTSPASCSEKLARRGEANWAELAASLEIRDIRDASICGKPSVGMLSTQSSNSILSAAACRAACAAATRSAKTNGSSASKQRFTRETVAVVSDLFPPSSSGATVKSPADASKERTAHGDHEPVPSAARRKYRPSRVSPVSAAHSATGRQSYSVSSNSSSGAALSSAPAAELSTPRSSSSAATSACRKCRRWRSMTTRRGAAPAC